MMMTMQMAMAQSKRFVININCHDIKGFSAALNVDNSLTCSKSFLLCQSRWSGKDSLILVIDASQDMFRECDGSIPFQLCIKVLIH